MLASLNLIFVLFSSKCVLFESFFVVDCLAGKWTDCVTKILVLLNLIFVFFSHPIVYYLNRLSVVDCLAGKWTNCVTKC